MQFLYSLSFLAVNQAELAVANVSRRELVERLDTKHKELVDKNTTVQSYLEKVVSASEDRSRVEGQLREASGKCAAFDAAKARMEQEAVLLQQHNEWLRSELTRKSEELLTSRKNNSAELLIGANALEATEREAAQAQRELVLAKESAVTHEAASTKRAHELRAAREAAAAAEAHFDQELTTSRRLAELYKKQADGRGAKTEELEGVLQSLQARPSHQHFPERPSPGWLPGALWQRLHAGDSPLPRRVPKTRHPPPRFL